MRTIAIQRTTVDSDPMLLERDLKLEIGMRPAQTFFDANRSNRALIVQLAFAALAIVVSLTNGMEPPTDDANVEPRVHLQSSSKPTASPKIIRYAQHLMTEYDIDHDGQLQMSEWKAMRGHPELIDQDGDQIVSLDELIRWNADYGRQRSIGFPVVVAPPLENSAEPTFDEVPDGSTETSSTGKRSNSNPSMSDRSLTQKFYVPLRRLPTGLPDWFLARDQDGDAQLTMEEFGPKGGTLDVNEFASYDANGDGVITAKECVSRRPDKAAKTSPSPKRRTAETD